MQASGLIAVVLFLGLIAAGCGFTPPASPPTTTAACTQVDGPSADTVAAENAKLPAAQWSEIVSGPRSRVLPDGHRDGAIQDRDEERDQLADIGRPARRTQQDAAYRFHDLGAGLVDADVVDLSDLLGHAMRGLRLDVTRAAGVYTNPIGTRWLPNSVSPLPMPRVPP